MHTTILEINEDVCIACQVETKLSFKPLIAHLHNRIKTEHPIKAQFYKFLLDRLEQLEGKGQQVTLADIENHSELLVLIFTILTPLVADEKDFFWAMSTPVPDKIFFSTDAFYDFYTDHKLRKKLDPEHVPDIERKQQMFIYQLILKKYYNFSSILKNEKLYTYTDPDTKLNRFYNIHADTQFVEVEVVGDLPEIDFERIGSSVHEGAELDLLKEYLPLSKFRLEGFTIITLTDVTLQNAVESIRTALVNHTYEREAYPHIIQSLKTLAGNSKIEFGLLPFLTVNDKLVFEESDCTESITIEAARAAGMDEAVFYAMVNDYRKNPVPLFYSKITDEKILENPFLKVIKESGVYSYTLLPIFHNKHLAGVMEVYSREEEIVVDEMLLSRLKAAMPLLSQLFQYSIDEFNAKIDAVLKDKFTSLQPSVQWKFNEVAFEYLAKTNRGAEAPVIDTVTFEDMYPLFGAVDIRNSTIERNIALREDLKKLLETLTATLKTIKEHIDLSLIDKLIYQTEDWVVKVTDRTTTNDEIMLSTFLEMEVNPLLQHIKTSHPEANIAIEAYFDAIKEDTGIAFEKRRALETSMQLINSKVSRYLDKAQASVQKSYPCYFSKFRTDGVEYDIYIGQSISPERPFSPMYLKNLRLWQIRSMVEIARLTADIATQMVKPLYTTQLIFIHSNPINISFRNDERRFDVEGAYNIRYEIVKKRIDKVLIKGTTERLTQPGKIAMVYFNHHEAAEYNEYIKYLQGEGFLTADTEHLELEELQGVSGLKAIRVGVRYPEPTENN
jgi:hypothetical protein